MATMIQPSSNANTPSIMTSTAALADSGGRRIAWNIQNLDTAVLYVCLGGTASATVFHVVLKNLASEKRTYFAEPTSFHPKILL